MRSHHIFPIRERDRVRESKALDISLCVCECVNGVYTSLRSQPSSSSYYRHYYCYHNHCCHRHHYYHSHRHPDHHQHHHHQHQHHHGNNLYRYSSQRRVSVSATAAPSSFIIIITAVIIIVLLFLCHLFLPPLPSHPFFCCVPPSSHPAPIPSSQIPLLNQIPGLLEAAIQPRSG